MFFIPTTKDDFKAILFQGNEFEIIKTLDVFIKLSDAKSIVSDLIKDAEFIECINTQTNNPSIDKRLEHLKKNFNEISKENIDHSLLASDVAQTEVKSSDGTILREEIDDVFVNISAESNVQDDNY